MTEMIFHLSWEGAGGMHLTVPTERAQETQVFQLTQLP